MTSSQGQVSGSAAEVYERFYVPALLGALAPRLADAAGVATGDEVLDVACGTGIVSREAIRRVGAGGTVTGLDRNEGMLAVARRLEPRVAWREGVAEALPFEAASFDAVVCQFGLMFFQDRTRALREMWRVLRPSGRLAVAVWGPIEDAPGYVALARLVRRRMDDAAAAEIDAPFALGDEKPLLSIFEDAGVRGVAVQTVQTEARFPSLDEWMHVEIRGWTLAPRVDDALFAQLLADARREFASLVQKDGTVRFPLSVRIVTARQTGL